MSQEGKKVTENPEVYGAFRFIALGVLNGIAMTVAHTETDEVIRIISARKATRYEEENG